jgi:hypothetical protein
LSHGCFGDRVLKNYFPGLALNYNPSNVNPPSNPNDRQEPLVPSWLDILNDTFLAREEKRSFFYYYGCCFETGFHYIAQAGLDCAL